MRLVSIGFLAASILLLNFTDIATAAEMSIAQNWQDSARLKNWDQCGADYTPPSWCDDLPDNIDVEQSYTNLRENSNMGKKAQAQRMLKAAKALENRVGAARNIQEGTLYKQDLMLITKQAEAGERESMELLAWMYIQGMMPKTDENLDSNEEAYIWYGKAFLAGAKRAQINMDEIWPNLSVTQQRRIVRFFDTQ